MTIVGRLAAAALMIVLAPVPVFATELEPNEFVTAPPGTTALTGYLVDHQSYQPVGGPLISQGTDLDDVFWASLAPPNRRL